MANFMGGSAPAMAAQVVDGLILLNANTLRTFLPADLNLLRFELEKLQRDARAEAPAPADSQAQQVRNRKIQRLSAALQVINHELSRKNR